MRKSAKKCEKVAPRAKKMHPRRDTRTLLRGATLRKFPKRGWVRHAGASCGPPRIVTPSELARHRGGPWKTRCSQETSKGNSGGDQDTSSPKIGQNPPKTLPKSSQDPPQILPDPSPNPSKIDPEGLLETILDQCFIKASFRRPKKRPKNAQERPREAPDGPKPLPNGAQDPPKTHF